MINLYHAGFQIITAPDTKIGRKNADFGQGFYLSDDEGFAKRWVRDGKGLTPYLNRYELDASELKVKRFERNAEWFEYISANRAGTADTLAAFDVIVGPIANDTIFDTWGVTTSGLLKKELALRLLLLGPAYEQTVVKTDKAARALRFVCATEIGSEEIAACKSAVRAEERRFQRKFAKLLTKAAGITDQTV